MDELIEVYEIRKALEPLAIRKAVTWITDAQLAEAERLQHRMDAEPDYAVWTDLNREFHSVLQRAANAPTLQSLVKNVQDTAAMYVAHSLKVDPSRIAEGNREHRAILAAMKARDGELAAKLLEDHLSATLELILRAQPATAP
jgi:DNA-binding GntR family transcriptional regulator